MSSLIKITKIGWHRLWLFALSDRKLVRISAVLGLLIVVALLVLSGPMIFTKIQIGLIPYMSSTWYAVYLDNGDTFYARIRNAGGGVLKLTNVHYLRTVQVGEQSTTSVVQRGEHELTSPKNYLMVEKRHVLYWEEIGDASSLLPLIGERP